MLSNSAISAEHDIQQRLVAEAGARPGRPVSRAQQALRLGGHCLRGLAWQVATCPHIVCQHSAKAATSLQRSVLEHLGFLQRTELQHLMM